jgi:hypothetical protein
MYILILDIHKKEGEFKLKKLKLLLAMAVIVILSFTSVAMAQEKNTVTRIEFIKMAMDLAKIELVDSTETSFKDIKAEDIPYVETAVKNKISSGYGDMFKPEKNITKEEAVTILVRALGEEAIAKRMDTEHIEIVYDELVSSWAKSYIVYGIKAGIIEEGGKFNPKELLTQEEAKKIIDKAANYYNTSLTREGLTAVKMLDNATKNLMDKKTYKCEMTMNINGKVKSEEDEQPINMIMNQEAQFEAPETMYVKQNVVVKDQESGEVKTNSEVFMKDRIMYIKSEGEEKWFKMDMNPMMNELQGLTGQNFNNVGVSKEQLEMFGMYAKYDKDVTLDGKNYYVISIDIDKDAFKEIMKQFADKAADMAVEQVANIEDEQNKDSEEIENFASDEQNKEMVKQMIKSMIENMDMEIGYKYYIEKETKMYDKMDIKMNMNMNMFGMTSEMNYIGNGKYYDFGKEVQFPEIKENDIQTMDDLMNDNIEE